MNECLDAEDRVLVESIVYGVRTSNIILVHMNRVLQVCVIRLNILKVIISYTLFVWDYFFV